MGFSRKPPRGHLPVYSVADEREAEALIVAACPTSYTGEYIAPELAREQTLENLEKFSERLDGVHRDLIASGQCRCRTNRP